jgi:hypothetical protein
MEFDFQILFTYITKSNLLKSWFLAFSRYRQVNQSERSIMLQRNNTIDWPTVWAQNKSRSTVRNYYENVEKYLRWLGRAPSEQDEDDFEEYTLYLLEERKLVASTVKLVNSSLSFFYTHIVHCPEITKFLVNLKTGFHLLQLLNKLS